MEENFYIRGDGTRVYFFGEDELKDIWSGRLFHTNDTSSINEIGDANQENVQVCSSHKDENQDLTLMEQKDALFEIASLGADRRLLINRHKQLKMYRCWMQGRFRKPDPFNAVSKEEDG